MRVACVLMLAVAAFLISAQVLGAEAKECGHPRIFVRKDGLAELRTRCRKDAGLSKKYEALLTFAKRFRIRAANPHRDATSLEALAFIYMVEDRSPEILEKIRSCLKPYLEGGPKVDKFGAARLLRAISVAFDWCYNGLTEDDRQKMGKLMVELAGTLYGTYRNVDYSNQLYVLQGDLVYPAVALQGEEGFEDAARKYMRDYGSLLKRNMLRTTNQVGSGGGWHEGVSYASFLAERFIPQLECWRVATGEDLFCDSDFCRHLPAFLVYTRVPGEKYMVPVNDAIYRMRWSGATEGAVMPLLVARYRDPLAAYVHQEAGKVGSQFQWPYLMWSEEHVEPESPEKLSLPLARHFRGLGWAAMRSDWSDTATYALFKSSPYYNSHQHWDDNSFYIYKRGELAIDPLGAKKTAATGFHNTLLIGGSQREHSSDQRMRFCQTEPGSTFDRGRIIAFRHRKHYMYVRGDASNAYPEAKLFTRDFLFVRPGCFVVLDSVWTRKPDTELKWLIHSESAPENREGGGFSIGAGKGKLLVKTMLPSDATRAVEKQGEKIICTSVTAPHGEGSQRVFLHFLQALDGDGEGCTPELAEEGGLLKLSWSASGLSCSVRASASEGLSHVRIANEKGDILADDRLEHPAVWLVDRAISDFENGTNQGWGGGKVVQGGHGDKFALQFADMGRRMLLEREFNIGRDTALQFGLYTTKGVKEIEFFAWSPDARKNFRHIIRDHKAGRWVDVKLRLSEAFTWRDPVDPAGKSLENICLWAKGPDDAVVKIDNVRITKEPLTTPAPAGELPPAVEELPPEEGGGGRGILRRCCKTLKLRWGNDR